MAITRGSVKNFARSYIREKTGDSAEEVDLDRFFLSAYREWAQESNWPEATWLDVTQAGVQEYRLPEDIIRLYRVYLRGNRCQPTTIPLMEGDIRQIFDGTWRRLPSQDPPDATTTLTSGAIPITAGPQPGRPLYYLRGAWVGFVNKPTSANMEIRIDGVSLPATPVDDNEALVFPPQFEDGLGYKTASLWLSSDDKPTLSRVAELLAEDQLDLARRWRRGLQGDLSQGIQIYDYRGHWRK